MGRQKNDEKVTIMIEGNSSMSIRNHDLTSEAAIALLSIVNEKDFAEDDKWGDYPEYVARVMETLTIPDFR